LVMLEHGATAAGGVFKDIRPDAVAQRIRRIWLGRDARAQRKLLGEMLNVET
jgi:hypothetical protein